jgi:transposase
MDTSDSYLVVERMIRQGEVSGSELERLLVVLEQQDQITLEEHKALLELAEGLSTADTPPS